MTGKFFIVENLLYICIVNQIHMKNNLEYNARRKKSSKKGKRFYTSRDMAILKKDIAIRKSQIKRGQAEQFGTECIIECGCGREGCFIHSGYNKT